MNIARPVATRTRPRRAGSSAVSRRGAVGGLVLGAAQRAEPVRRVDQHQPSPPAARRGGGESRRALDLGAGGAHALGELAVGGDDGSDPGSGSASTRSAMRWSAALRPPGANTTSTPSAAGRVVELAAVEDDADLVAGRREVRRAARRGAASRRGGPSTTRRAATRSRSSRQRASASSALASSSCGTSTANDSAAMSGRCALHPDDGREHHHAAEDLHRRESLVVDQEREQCRQHRLERPDDRRARRRDVAKRGDHERERDHRPDRDHERRERQLVPVVELREGKRPRRLDDEPEEASRSRTSRRASSRARRGCPRAPSLPCRSRS